jgi:MFS family permease
VTNRTEASASFVGAVFFIGYGLLTWWASIDGLQHLWGLSSFWAGALSFPIAYVPILGQAVGIYGIIEVWHWQWYWAVLLFAAPILIVLALVSVSAAIEAAQRRRNAPLARAKYEAYVAEHFPEHRRDDGDFPKQ